MTNSENCGICVSCLLKGANLIVGTQFQNIKQPDCYQNHDDNSNERRKYMNNQGDSSNTSAEYQAKIRSTTHL